MPRRFSSRATTKAAGACTKAEELKAARGARRRDVLRQRRKGAPYEVGNASP